MSISNAVALTVVSPVSADPSAASGAWAIGCANTGNDSGNPIDCDAAVTGVESTFSCGLFAFCLNQRLMFALVDVSQYPRTHRSTSFLASYWCNRPRRGILGLLGGFSVTFTLLWQLALGFDAFWTREPHPTFLHHTCPDVIRINSTPLTMRLAPGADLPNLGAIIARLRCYEEIALDPCDRVHREHEDVCRVNTSVVILRQLLWTIKVRSP